MTKAFELLLVMLGKHFGKRGSKIVICLILMAFGIKNCEIREKFGTSYDSLRKYRTALESGNVDPLFVTNNADSRMKSELLKYDKQIMDDFDKNPPSTVREAQTRIEALTGVKRNLTRIRAYLKKRGLKVEQ